MDVTGGRRGIIILAGGEGVRMGRSSKVFRILDGKHLLRYVFNNALKVSQNVVIAAGKSDSKHQIKNVLPKSTLVVEDELEGKGPLAGIAAGLRSIEADYVAVLPCDTPFINPRVLEFLFLKASRADAAIPLWPEGYREPLQAVYRFSSILSAVEEALKMGELGVMDAVKKLKKIVYVSVEEIREIDPELMSFFNINTQQDFEKARSILKKVSLR